MTTKRRLALLSSLAATPAFAAPFLAIGDNAELYLTARTEARYEDNVTFASGLPGDPVIEDTAFEFVPGAQLLFGKNSLTTGSLTFFERFLRYADESRFNDDLANVNFKATYEGAKLRLVSDASFRQLNQNTGDENVPNSLVRRDVTDIGVAGELSATEKSKVGVGARYNKTDYRDTGFGVDREIYIIPVNYYFAITPKVDLSAGIQYTVNDIHAANEDSDQIYYNVGARGDFTAKLTGSFSVGYSTRNPEEGDDDSTVGVRAGLVYLYSLKTQFTLDLSNDFASASNGSGQEVSSISFGVKSAISPGLVATASLGYKKIDYLDTALDDRKDDYITALVGFTYTVNQYMSVDVYYNYLDNSSDVDAAEFEANLFSVAANFRY